MFLNKSLFYLILSDYDDQLTYFNPETEEIQKLTENKILVDKIYFSVDRPEEFLVL